MTTETTLTLADLIEHHADHAENDRSTAARRRGMERSGLEFRAGWHEAAAKLLRSYADLPPPKPADASPAYRKPLDALAKAQGILAAFCEHDAAREMASAIAVLERAATELDAIRAFACAQRDRMNAEPNPVPPTGDDWNELFSEIGEHNTRLAFPDAPDARSALQWLLDDMADAGETHNDDGRIYDSVVCAARTLVNLGGMVPWFDRDISKEYDSDGRKL